MSANGPQGDETKIDAFNGTLDAFVAPSRTKRNYLKNFDSGGERKPKYILSLMFWGDGWLLSG